MRNKFLKINSLIILFTVLPLMISAQASGVGVNIIVNGGIFEFSPPYVDYVTLNARHTYYGDFGVVDTIYTQSAQDIVIDGEFFYVAAADSIVQYNINGLSVKRLNATAFGAPSTIKMIVYEDKLIAGNWYGSSENNLRIFDKNTLVFLDSIPEIKYGAKDFVIYKDSLFIQQNLSSSTFEDSAGFILVVDLKNMQYVRDISLNNNNQDLGRLFTRGDSLIGINSVSNTLTVYNFKTGQSNNVSVSGDIEVGPYGQQFSSYRDNLFLKADGAIKKFDLKTFALDNKEIVDSVTSFILDTMQGMFITTKSDFASYSYGSDHSLNGNKRTDFKVGYAPEVIGGIYGVWEGIESFNHKPLNIFPNPFMENIQIDMETESGNLEIYDSHGKLVHHKRNLRGKTNLDLGTLPSGIYFAKVIGNGQIWSNKIVKSE